MWLIPPVRLTRMTERGVANPSAPLGDGVELGGCVERRERLLGVLVVQPHEGEGPVPGEQRGVGGGQSDAQALLGRRDVLARDAGGLPLEAG